jgi:molybdate transport system substrate-binding protein
VGAASNLAGVLEEVTAAFTKQSGIGVVLSYGSTAQLAQQIEQGAPFDVFAAADTEHVDQLVQEGKLVRETRAVYAQGQLALWIPKGEAMGIREMKDLALPNVRFLALAKPQLAPYGAAALEAIRGAGLLDKLQPKLVYANDIRTARQFADTGNADAAFVAYSLVLKERGVLLKIDPKLHTPILQALGVVTASEQQAKARRFAAFLLGAEGRAILIQEGYLAP